MPTDNSVAARRSETPRNSRPALSSGFQRYLTKHNYITCRGCHSLSSFGGPRSHMKMAIHQGMVNADSYNCLECHVNIGHVYEQSSSTVSGWYTVEQAAAGKKLFEDSCSRCHGAKLESGFDQTNPLRLGAYADLIAEMDYRVGQIVDCVDAAGVADNTIIVFSSDNGPGLIESRMGPPVRAVRGVAGS